MKTPFYKHTSVLLAIAFTAGVGVGSLSDSLNAHQSQSSILARSMFIQDLTRDASVASIGQVLAYDVYEGDVVEEKVGDEETESASDVLPVETEEDVVVPKKIRSLPSQVSVPAVSCDVAEVKKPVHQATPVTKAQSIMMDASGVIRVSILYRNDGNTTWFSEQSGCGNTGSGAVVQLGTIQPLDHDSLFASSDPTSGWAASNRVIMSSGRVNPGEEALFTFDIKAPVHEDVYREVFAMVVPGVTWVAESESSLDVTVGVPYDEETAKKKLRYINGAGYGSVIDVNAEKRVEVDLSEQKAYLKIGDYLVREFSVSTGARKTPTPVGTWKVLFKQQARIGGASPHYIMPKWQAIRPDGYGFHALPVLGNATLRAKIRSLGPDQEVPTEWFTNDAFWSEALDHIGTPRSHGCVRFLPDDAAYVYDFTDVGTPIEVRK